MVRTSSALFIPGAENLLLSLIFYFGASAVMDQTMPSDFAPAMRAVLFSQLLIVVGTICVHLVLAIVDKSHFVLPSASISDYAAQATDADSSSAAAAAVGSSSASASAARKIALLIASRTDYRYALNVANAYCTCMLCLFLLYGTMFLQAISGSGLDAAVEARASSSTYSSYASSQRLDWLQGTVGASGWVKQTASTYAADASAPPLFGGMFAGVVLAFLVICLLLSVYMSYMATPEGESSYMFFEPRGLIVTNGIVAFGSTYTIEKHFARCAGDSVVATVCFGLYCLLVCWLDGLVEIVRDRLVAASSSSAADSASLNNKNNSSRRRERVLRIVQYIVIQTMALVPLVGLLATHPVRMPMAVLWMCIVLTMLSSAMGIFDVLFAQRRSTLQQAMALVVQRADASTSSVLSDPSATTTTKGLATAAASASFSSSSGGGGNVMNMMSMDMFGGRKQQQQQQHRQQQKQTPSQPMPTNSTSSSRRSQSADNAELRLSNRSSLSSNQQKQQRQQSIFLLSNPSDLILPPAAAGMATAAPPHPSKKHAA